MSARLLFVKNKKGEFIPKHPEDLLQADAKGNCCLVIFKTEKENEVFALHHGLKWLEGRLPPELFIRVHHSHIIQLDSIRSYDRPTHWLELKNETKMYVGRKYRKNLEEKGLFLS